MKLLRTLTSATAAAALAVGALTTPIASAGHAPETRWPNNVAPADRLSTIEELDIEQEAQKYFKRDDNGEFIVEDGNFISNPPDHLKWLTPAYNKRKNVKFLTATSPAMDGAKVNLAVITPTGNFDRSRPTIYLLNGAGGAEQGIDWLVMTDGEKGNTNLIDFYIKKDVNVVVVQDGAFSYYTDWVNAPKTDYLDTKQMWETFLIKELPGPLEHHINGNGKRAIAGMSMSATSALLLAEHNPGFYDAVGSYSGCAATSTPMPWLYTSLTVQRGGATPEQMWGPRGGAYSRFNDALINSNNLRGAHVYVSTSTGLPGENEMLSSFLQNGNTNLSSAFKSSSTVTIEGGAIEAAMYDCTTQLKRKMDREGIPADWNFRPTGTHSWPGWKEDIWKSWNTYAKAFGQPEGYGEDPNRGIVPAPAPALRSAVDPTAEKTVTELNLADLKNLPADILPGTADAPNADAAPTAPAAPAAAAAPAAPAPAAPAGPTSGAPAPAPEVVAPAPAPTGA
ncbi:esterase family protein [Corynebacterium lizhenjunii]|uniref:Esterase family protein n=1 Tax=Corynebacterium lizhenjunii TaxID=2709394 RepID=A0A7T0KFX8_9CORY|nr:alpha/beta hydrolase family protein [Corynebacterium lizhenjunii]QPK79374.1 esterase family protein [Corynebacterium lizhenjunii]